MDDYIMSRMKYNHHIIIGTYCLQTDGQADRKTCRGSELYVNGITHHKAQSCLALLKLSCSEWESRPFPEEPEVRLYFTSCTRLPLLTVTPCHYEANSQLATHTQPQVQKFAL